MSYQTKNFRGQINNKTIYDFFSKLDYTFKQDDRLNLIKQLLYTQIGYENTYLDEFFEVYFNNKFVYSPKQNDYLSSDNNVCSILELMANYILFSNDAEKIKKINYNFYTKNQLQSKFGKEYSIEELIEKSYSNSVNESSVSFLLNNNQNYKKCKSQVITQKDINNNSTINNYEELKSLINKKLKSLRINNSDKMSQKKLVQLLKDIKSDQMLCKDKMDGVIYFKNPLPDSHDIDYEQFDMNESKHIIELLQCHNSLLTDIGCLKYDIMNLVNNMKLNYKESKILNLYINNYSTKEISDMLCLRHNYVKYKISSLGKKIANEYFLSLEEWYYTFISKGTYKKCSKCNKTFLLNLNHFRFNKISKSKFSSWCRNCENLSKLSKK
jgi:DNA-binding CsgD family transcriptional regulator